MAWLEQHPTSSLFKICFRWGGKQLKKTVKTTSRSDAEAILLRLEENIGLVERGRLQLPPDADIATFLLSDGKVANTPRVQPPPRPLTLAELRDASAGSCHQGHLARQVSHPFFSGTAANWALSYRTAASGLPSSLRTATRDLTGGSSTMRKVASGPSSSENSHHSRPLRPFDCARPALMSESVPQPIA